MKADQEANGVVFDAAAMKMPTGISLVEASAGTGKTYAISMLVLRLIAEKNIAIDQILIVTFTKAATEELRGRIRTRLDQGRKILAGLMKESEEYDATLKEWADQVISGGKKRLPAQVL